MAGENVTAERARVGRDRRAPTTSTRADTASVTITAVPTMLGSSVEVCIAAQS